ncbi:type IV pilus secretin PilQ family protein [Vibrio europaeus]|uniref:Type IV pilus secretin PilQ family protein n=2 Tax=Vibrio europaeus TaxID=300876 RepID=A0ABT5GTY1_9VIBR|nr:type IV pilus secretin PilQ family protein [Vibrio europaeus]MDC5704032.1 type IV pilus secretin PilQ family protein [Vibrio europaeus]MDC5708549.1 type IV pilus secretin PilQ family protein [Vibrio europaeus]MDC5713446.1 type IV pilus secretin PilQ family protein [Vibrio europaeus]MDC5718840.1 type IV pilus secretin PilQ family protein [Vibrio europaeus]MDC5724868.1 type IV pilus secretin PilQ family protein [Vibrio europaeus]
MVALARSCLQWFSLFVVLFPSVVYAHEQNDNLLQGLDFKLDEQRNAQIVLTLSDSRAVVDILKVAQGLSITLPQTQVTEALIKVFDVTEFGTAVRDIEVFRHPDKVELIAAINGDFRYHDQLEGTRLQVTVASSSDGQQVDKTSLLDKPGKKLSLNFQDIPVRNVLQLIADYNDFNLVVSDSVTGNLTLRLEEVSWQKVLDIILQVKGLDKRVEGSIVLVAPKAELDAREQQMLEKARLKQQLGKLSSEIIQVKFAKAADIAGLIDAGGEFSMLSPRGSLSVDERTNALLIRDLEQNVDVIRSIVESLDIPVKQVQIEARIVTVNEGNLDELGVRWGFSNTNGSTSIGASIEDNVFDVVPIDDMLNVNLGTTSANASTIAFQVAKLGSDMLLDLELSALQRESKAEVISSPRLITTNKKPAYIEQGSEIPYLESSSSGATSVSFKKAVLSLKVTPQITPDNRLILDLSVTQDRPGDVVKTGTGEAVAINTQRIGTQVLVENGETVVLGGIFQHSVTDAVDKVPFFGDLPLLGALFRRTYQQMGKSELLIFVTPKVVIE